MYDLRRQHAQLEVALREREGSWPGDSLLSIKRRTRAEDLPSSEDLDCPSREARETMGDGEEACTHGDCCWAPKHSERPNMGDQSAQEPGHLFA